MLRSFAIASALAGCTIIGGVQGGQSAHYANQRRERAIARGVTTPPPERNVGASILGGALIGFVIDFVVVVVAVSQLTPKD